MACGRITPGAVGALLQAALLAAHVAHRVSATAGRRDAGAQVCVRAMAATVADAIIISSTGSTTTLRNLAAGRIAVMPRDRDRGKRKRHARRWPAPAAARAVA